MDEKEVWLEVSESEDGAELPVDRTGLEIESGASCHVKPPIWEGCNCI